jgi:putative LysE/RhtB family amino acid efflux pump
MHILLLIQSQNPLDALETSFLSKNTAGSMKSMIQSVLKGAWLGLCIAAPIGPIGMLVLKESLKRGPRAGLACGFGAALADLTYGSLAVAGVRILNGYDRLSAVFGGSFLLWLAWKSWREKPAIDAPGVKGSSLLNGTLTTFVLTISNPMTILLFAALLAATRPGAPGWFVTGVFLGSMLWWTMLSTAAGSVRSLIDIRPVVLSRLAALTLAAFGTWAILVKGLK